MTLRRTLFIACFSVLAFSCANRRLARREHYMRHIYAALKDSLADADVTLLRDSVRVLFPRNVMFDYNKATVRDEFSPVLLRFAHVLVAEKKTGILVVGHTDSVGGDNSYNLQLSRRRADSARAVLAFYGVAEGRLDAWGLGAKMPIATNATEEGRQANRRVEFIVLYNYRKGDAEEPK